MSNENVDGRQVSRVIASGCAAALCIGLGVGPASGQDPLFETGARSYRLDTGFECGDLRPIEHITADVDGDGDLDLIHSYG